MKPKEIRISFHIQFPQIDDEKEKLAEDDKVKGSI